MWPAVQHETMTSLRARNQAYRLATGILYEHPIDATSIECSQCGESLRAGWADWFGRARCPQCGTVNTFPPYVVAQIRDAKPEMAPPLPPGPLPMEAWWDGLERRGPDAPKFAPYPEQERDFRVILGVLLCLLVLVIAALVWLAGHPF